jgi:putative chitinase
MSLQTDRLLFMARKSSQTDLKRLLDAINADKDWDLIRDVAYFLGTVQHETGGTYKPLEEIGRGKGRPYGVPTSNGKIYYGRGFVQITWKTNYLKAGRLLGIDLVSNPEMALEFEIAYKIAARGMREGWFTGKRLGDYLGLDGGDYVAARAIINGTDQAQRIADYAELWEKAIKHSNRQVEVAAVAPSAEVAAATVVQDAPGSFSLSSVTGHFDEAKDTIEKAKDAATEITSFVGKRSDTIKSFRIFLTQSLTGMGAALSGFYTNNKTMIYIGLAIFAVIGVLYFLRQWHLGAIREKKQ